MLACGFVLQGHGILAIRGGHASFDPLADTFRSAAQTPRIPLAQYQQHKLPIDQPLPYWMLRIEPGFYQKGEGHVGRGLSGVNLLVGRRHLIKYRGYDYFLDGPHPHRFYGLPTLIKFLAAQRLLSGIPQQTKGLVVAFNACRKRFTDEGVYRVIARAQRVGKQNPFDG